jgi:hypothetical protein
MLNIKLANTALVAMVKPWYLDTEKQGLIKQAIRAVHGFTDEQRLELFASQLHVCKYCKRRKTEYADHILPLVWFRMAPRLGIVMSDTKANGQGLCVVCNNRKQRREESMGVRLRNACAKRHGKYVLALCREFLATERKEANRFNRWKAKRNAIGKTSRITFAECERTLTLLFSAFDIKRNGAGNADWRGKVQRLPLSYIVNVAMPELSRKSIPNRFRNEFAHIWESSQSAWAIFQAALQNVYVMRRAHDNESRAACVTCLNLRAKFYATLAANKIPLNNWRNKASGEVYNALDSLNAKFRAAKDKIMDGTRLGEDE